MSGKGENARGEGGDIRSERVYKDLTQGLPGNSCSRLASELAPVGARCCQVVPEYVLFE